VILGIVGLITPIVVTSGTVYKEIPISFIALFFMFLLSNGFMSGGEKILSRWDGLILLGLFADVHRKKEKIGQMGGRIILTCIYHLHGLPDHGVKVHKVYVSKTFKL